MMTAEDQSAARMRERTRGSEAVGRRRPGRIVFVFSMPRSGSTWLGKIFDSHPDVMYLHEPGVDDRGLDLIPSYWLEGAPNALQIENARLYLDRLASNRSLRATGTLPMFRKSYRGIGAHKIRTAVIVLGKGLERAGSDWAARRFRVPDFREPGREPLLVIKSVSAMGLAESFVRAGGERFSAALLIRHPCSYVSSMLRGHKLGLMQLPGSLQGLLVTRSAKRFDVQASHLRGASQTELLAWTWLLQNEEARRAVSDSGITIRYEDLALDPLEGANSLFGKLGLSWSAQTEQFLARTIRREGGYYSMFRNPFTSISRWREELDDAQVATIRHIVSRSELGRSYFVE